LLRSDQAELFALLGTPNGKGPAWMLATYPEMFGRKVITSAIVDVSTNKPNICWVLEELENEPAPPPSQPATPPSLSRKGRRQEKKRRERQERTV
jgi:hypothetical protein